MLFADRMKVVIDANVVISGLIAKKKGRDKAPPYMVLKQLESRMFTLMTNGYIIAEYARKLNEKAQGGLINPEDCSKYMDLFQKEGVGDRTLITPVIYVVSDPSDNIYFQSGNCLNADFLITGNTTDFDTIKPDLKKLRRKLQIVTPSEFIKRER